MPCSTRPSRYKSTFWHKTPCSVTWSPSWRGWGPGAAPELSGSPHHLRQMDPHLVAASRLSGRPDLATIDLDPLLGVESDQVDAGPKTLRLRGRTRVEGLHSRLAHVDEAVPVSERHIVTLEPTNLLLLDRR